MRADASIGPYKWGLGLQQEIYVPTRRGEGTHLQPIAIFNNTAESTLTFEKK